MSRLGVPLPLGCKGLFPVLDRCSDRSAVAHSLAHECGGAVHGVGRRKLRSADMTDCAVGARFRCGSQPGDRTDVKVRPIIRPPTRARDDTADARHAARALDIRVGANRTVKVTSRLCLATFRTGGVPL